MKVFELLAGLVDASSLRGVENLVGLRVLSEILVNVFFDVCEVGRRRAIGLARQGTSRLSLALLRTVRQVVEEASGRNSRCWWSHDSRLPPRSIPCERRTVRRVPSDSFVNRVFCIYEGKWNIK